MQLSVETINTQFMSPSTTYNYSGGTHKIEIPQSNITIPKPLTYEFRVAEFLDASGAISKVGLQVRIWEHNNLGVGIVKQEWKDVERVQIPHVG
jgi:hypothetical protein